METILLLTYFSFCWIVFKIFNISVNKWSLTTVVLGAVVMMGTILAGMAYYHPASMSARSYFLTTPIVANVRGKVIEIPVETNVPLQKGDVLFKIDPTPFQGKVDNLQAQLEFSRKRLADSIELVKIAGGAKFDIDQYKKEVRSLEGQLVTAQFNLDSCTVRAPGPGFVTHLRVRPGQMAVPLPLMPVMTFVNSDSVIFIAGFNQQPMQNIKVGNDAEVIFPGIPGRVFKARVEKILPALAEGEITAARNMFSISRQLPEGQVPVLLTFVDDMSGYYLPLGSNAVATVYSEHWHHVTIIRKMLIRMESWRNFAKFH